MLRVPVCSLQIVHNIRQYTIFQRTAWRLEAWTEDSLPLMGHDGSAVDCFEGSSLVAVFWSQKWPCLDERVELGGGEGWIWLRATRVTQKHTHRVRLFIRVIVVFLLLLVFLIDTLTFSCQLPVCAVVNESPQRSVSLSVSDRGAAVWILTLWTSFCSTPQWKTDASVCLVLGSSSTYCILSNTWWYQEPGPWTRTKNKDMSQNHDLVHAVMEWQHNAVMAWCNDAVMMSCSDGGNDTSSTSSWIRALENMSLMFSGAFLQLNELFQSLQRIKHQSQLKNWRSTYLHLILSFQLHFTVLIRGGVCSVVTVVLSCWTLNASHINVENNPFNW